MEQRASLVRMVVLSMSRDVICVSVQTQVNTREGTPGRVELMSQYPGMFFLSIFFFSFNISVCE